MCCLPTAAPPEVRESQGGEGSQPALQGGEQEGQGGGRAVGQGQLGHLGVEILIGHETPNKMFIF